MIRALIKGNEIQVRGLIRGTDEHQAIKLLDGEWCGVRRYWIIRNTAMRQRVLKEMGAEIHEVKGRTP
jgi:hypothetical protein